MKPGAAPFRPDAPIVPELSAGAVVVHEPTGEMLLLHLADEDRWCLPKGHVDPGESLSVAALREIEEETGLREIELREELGEVSYRFYRPKHGANVHKASIYFLALTHARDVRLEPIFDRYAWLSPEAAIATVTYDADRTIVVRARERMAGAPASGPT